MTRNRTEAEQRRIETAACEEIERFRAECERLNAELDETRRGRSIFDKVAQEFHAERDALAATLAEREAQLDEIALATGWGERPEGQDGVNRAPDLAERVTKTLRRAALDKDMREIAERAVVAVGEWLKMDPQGIFEDPSSVVLAVRAARAEALEEAKRAVSAAIPWDEGPYCKLAIEAIRALTLDTKG
jgi:hypothetical protein